MELIKHLKADCKKYGRGRKAWWAKELGVPPLTISHWLAGRQKPGGDYSLAIQQMVTRLDVSERADRYIEYLWDAYYGGSKPPGVLLGEVILTILKKQHLLSRVLVLLSVVVENLDMHFEIPYEPYLKNRLGWLLESSGKNVLFKPARLSTDELLESFSHSPEMKSHLKTFQTPLGKKWKIYDFSLTQTKESLPCPKNWKE